MRKNRELLNKVWEEFEREASQKKNELAQIISKCAQYTRDKVVERRTSVYQIIYEDMKKDGWDLRDVSQLCSIIGAGI